jgi:hypothetical protein
MTGLDHLLRMGQVAPDKDVDVWSVITLVEWHQNPPFSRTVNSASGGI